MCGGLPVQRNHQGDTTQPHPRDSPRHGQSRSFAAQLSHANIGGESRADWIVCAYTYNTDRKSFLFLLTKLWDSHFRKF